MKLQSTKLEERGWTYFATSPQLVSLEIDFGRQSIVEFSPKTVVDFLERKPLCELKFSRGRKIEVETIRELARTGADWPPYKSPGK